MIVFSSNSEFLDFFLIIILLASIGVIEIWLLLKPSGRNIKRLQDLEQTFIKDGI